MFLFFFWQFTFPSTRFLPGFKPQLPFPLSGRSITFTGSCQGETLPAILYFHCVFLHVCTCARAVCGYARRSLGLCSTRSERAPCWHARVCVYAAAASPGVPGRVLLHKAIQASLRTSTRSWGPCEMPDWGAGRAFTHEHLFTLRIAGTPAHAGGGMARWRSHANMQKGNAALRLICHFSKISGKWQAAGNTGSRCLAACLAVPHQPLELFKEP